MDQPLWQPSPRRVSRTNLTSFIDDVNAAYRLEIDDMPALYRWSVDHGELFWSAVKEHARVVAETWGERVLVDGDRMPGARWFPDARLNFAQNLLRRRDETDAVVFRGERRDQPARRLSWRELYDRVSRVSRALRAAGVAPGDRVAAYLPNIPEAIVCMLAAASVGAVWSSSSPDFGVQGVLDRFGQIEPRVLIAADGYSYKGKTHGSLEKVRDIVAGLPSLERVIVTPHLDPAPDITHIPRAETLQQFVSPFEPGEISFSQLPFDHPLYIMYSSGTTGVPKCIVHGAGGTLLQHLKEHQLHCDIKPGDRVFYFTTCGWMMWNWLASALASEATLLLYDGSPLFPDADVLWDFLDDEEMTLFGTSAKYIDTLRKSGVRPGETHRLDSLRLMTSTGSPLSDDGFDYVYREIKPDLQLASISGGTDILGCFVCGDPIGPVHRGEIQTRALGMRVEVFDPDGAPLLGEPGELVCTAPFPSMPVEFWNDPGGDRYHAAYFARFPGVWCHGDWAELTARGGVIIHGRSDATLNPGGVRIGTAEIYQQVELLDQVIEAIAVGQQLQGDVRVLLFVVLRDGLVLDGGLVGEIKNRLRQRCSPSHVPARVIQVPDIPRTRSGKITELAVRDVVHGRPVSNREALANPEALEYFVLSAEDRQ